MHLTLTGATGLIGSAVLDAMLRTAEITRISILARRPVCMAEQANDPRVHVVKHTDFGDYGPDVLGQLQGANGVVWALGVSQTKARKEEYETITKTWALAAAKAFSRLVPDKKADTTTAAYPFRFIFVSGLSATQEPGRFTTLQARVKGETELQLSQLVTDDFHIEAPRPGAVDPKGHAAIAPFVPDPGTVARYARAAVLPLMSRFAGLHSPTEELGRCLVWMAMGRFDARMDEEQKEDGDVFTVGKGLRVVTNGALRRWMAEEKGSL
ncbi:hypothetical protein BX600DRAFT_156960 [Xylariales sp. PMI_506]|nr:hypothetical protein BX600DRAFT_156960 [Xylariales sp. PMI_506]